MSDLPEEKTITLRKPVSLGSETYTELRLREPTAGEWVQFSKYEAIEQDLMAVAVVSGVPRPALEKIGSRDLKEAAKFVANFL